MMPDYSKFADVAAMHPGNKLPYICKCGTETPLLKRVVAQYRTCRQCGDLITEEKIDREVVRIGSAISAKKEREKQAAQQGCGCILLASLCILLASLLVSLLSQCLKS